MATQQSQPAKKVVVVEAQPVTTKEGGTVTSTHTTRPSTMYRVKNRKTFSIQGQMVTWNPGDVIDVASYGPGAKQRMLDAGVQLEELR